MAEEDPEAYLRAMVAPPGAARRGGPLPGAAFSREAVANAFVMLGLLLEPRAEEILAEYRPGLEAEGFRVGVLTGELSVRSGAHGFQDARAAGRDGLTRSPLAVAAGPAHMPLDGVDLSLTWVTLTPGGVHLRFHATMQDSGRMSGTLGEQIQSGLSVTDNMGRRYRGVLGSVRGSGMSGWGEERAPRWDGEILAEPEPHAAEPAKAGAVRWLEFTTPFGAPARVVMRPPASVATGPAEPPWRTPAERYLAVLASVTSMSIGADGATVELDTARIVAAVANSLLWVGAVPPDSVLLSDGAIADGGHRGWREPLMGESAFSGGLPLESPVHLGSADAEKFGEVGDGVVAGGVHAPQFGLLPGGQLGLFAAQSALGSRDRHPFPGSDSQQVDFDYVDRSRSASPIRHLGADRLIRSRAGEVERSGCGAKD